MDKCYPYKLRWGRRVCNKIPYPYPKSSSENSYSGREITGKGPVWEQLHKPVIKDPGRSPGNLLPASMYTQTDSKEFRENSDWGTGISGKTPG
jgi:hypothetical protein